MTNKETNWIEEFEKQFVAGNNDSNFCLNTDNPLKIEDFISKLISQEKEKWNESVIKMLEDTDVQMSVNGDVSQDEKAMAKFLYKAHINHIKKKLQKDVSTTSINTDSAKS